MHICLLTPSFPPMVDGGVAISTGRLVQCLLRRGHQITVVTTAPPANLKQTTWDWHIGSPPPETGEGQGGSEEPGSMPPALAPPSQPFPATASAEGRQFNGAPSPAPGGRSMALHYGLVEDPLRAAPAVEALCVWTQAQHQREPFDVILAYFVYPAGYLATMLGEILGVPVVSSCRGNDISKEMFITPEIIAAVLTRSTRLIFVSASLLHMADTLVPCRAKATVAANAVDSTLFTPDASAITAAHRAVVVGTSGLMRWKKGIDLFLPLIRALCAMHDVQILVAGYGLDAAIDQHIADFLERYNLRQQLEITGPLPHQQMVHALRRMDLYVNTSYQEGMPNGVLEAMACALPVVATDADGTPDLMQDGVTGYLCPMGDLDMLVARCRTLITRPDLRQRMGQAGRRRVQQHFQPDQEAIAVETVLWLAYGERNEAL